MFLLDRFFDGTFFTYGIEVMSFADRDQEDRIDPMIYVFPRYSIHNLYTPRPHVTKRKDESNSFLEGGGWQLLSCNRVNQGAVKLIPFLARLSILTFTHRMTKCTFHKFGTSGNIEKHDALCILPLNIGKT